MQILRSALTGFVLLTCLSRPAFSQCRDWTDALAQSFLSNSADIDALKQQFSQLSAEQYATTRAGLERQNQQDNIARSVVYSPAISNLKPRLRQFYQIGASLYGVQFDAENIHVLPDMARNAFATGRHVFFNEGILLYYIDPIQFLVRAGVVPQTLTPEERAQVAATFNWRNDWDSLYFVLAHEASHNLMAHGDERIMEGVNSQVHRFASDASAQRRAIAEGRSSPGLKRYLGQSLLSFFSQAELSRQKVSQEEEADVVGSEILRRAGLRADSGLLWLQRMSLLSGQSSSGWQSIMNSLLCSTHPNTPQRMANLQQNVACLQALGRPCSKHVTYAVAERLGMVRAELEGVEHYEEETNAIAEGRLKFENLRQAVEIKRNPKDASLLIDGASVATSIVSLPVGRHILWATREGYRPAQINFSVFPDVAKATLQFRLEKCKKGMPC